MRPGMRRQQLVEVELGRHFPAELEQRGDEFLILWTGSGFGHVEVVRASEASDPKAEPEATCIIPVLDGPPDAAARVRGD